MYSSKAPSRVTLNQPQAFIITQFSSSPRRITETKQTNKITMNFIYYIIYCIHNGICFPITHSQSPHPSILYPATKCVPPSKAFTQRPQPLSKSYQQTDELERCGFVVIGKRLFSGAAHKLQRAEQPKPPPNLSRMCRSASLIFANMNPFLSSILIVLY